MNPRRLFWSACLLLSVVPCVRAQSSDEDLRRRIAQINQQYGGVPAQAQLPARPSQADIDAAMTALKEANEASNTFKGLSDPPNPRSQKLDQLIAQANALIDKNNAGDPSAAGGLVALTQPLRAAKNTLILGSPEPLQRGEYTLPDAFPKDQDYIGYQHIIFVDQAPPPAGEADLRPDFKREMNSLYNRLLNFGVPDADIHIIAVKSSQITPADFVATVNRYPGKKRIYHSGHGNSLDMAFGGTGVPLDQVVAGLCTDKCPVCLASGGCRVNDITSPTGKARLQKLEAALPRGSTFILYGYERTSSTGEASNMMNMSNTNGLDGEQGHYVRRVIAKDDNGSVTIESEFFEHHGN